MQKNDIFRMTVEDINNLGYGVGHLQNADGSKGKTVFVAGGVPGDNLNVKAIKINKDYIVARTEEVLHPSERRVQNDCSANGCGGCIYRNISYEYELELKRQNVINSFRRSGLFNAVIEPVKNVGKTERYRNKAQYPVGNGKNGMIAGFYAGSTHRIAETADCVLQPKVFSDIVSFICKFCDDNSIKAYDEQSGKGILRHIFLRKATLTDDIMVCLVVNGSKFPKEELFTQKTTELFPDVCSIVINENRENTNVVLGDKFRTVWGKDYIEDILCGVKLRISPGSFYQVNHDACELLYRTGIEKANLGKDETVIDLYCGIGSIGLSMSEFASRIVGIEIVPEAVECAKQNAKINNISNAYFYCGDASDANKLLTRAEEQLGSLDGSTVIMDPPRKGSTPELINYIATKNINKILYISCNPDTLARDCALFVQLGYSMSSVTPVDLFPRTGHVETVVLLSKLSEAMHR